MKENCGPELYKHPFAGASAGSITAALLLTGANLDVLADSAIEEAERAEVFTRPTGLAGVWGPMVERWLYKNIPDDYDQERLKYLQIAVTPNFSKPKLVSGFNSKPELIQAILASCHVPIFLDGRLFSDYKGERVIDGSFWCFITKDRSTGLPLPTNGVNKENIFWVDYCDDEDFRSTISGNFLALTTPEGLHDMIDHGYNFMKRQHYARTLPFVRFPRPNFVRVSLGLPGSVSYFPSNMKKAMNEINYEALYKVPMEKIAAWYSAG